MEEAERRLLLIIPLVLSLVFILLYLASTPCSIPWSCSERGGPWRWGHLGPDVHRHQLQHRGRRRVRVALRGGHHGRFAADFLVQRPAHQGRAAAEAIMEGAVKRRVRPVMMTALTAIFGLLPEAVSRVRGSG